MANRKVGNPFGYRGEEPTVGQLNQGTGKDLTSAILGRKAFMVTATGLKVATGATQYEWEEFGSDLAHIKGALQWIIGDWIVYGEEARFAVERQRMADVFDLELHTLDNYAAIARKFPLTRRRESLSFGHHDAVAGLDEADQKGFLDNAETAGWSVAKLRAAIKRKYLTPLPGEIPIVEDESPPAMLKRLHEMTLRGQGSRTARERALSKISQIERWLAHFKSLLNVP